jgi:hypothetical protein
MTENLQVNSRIAAGYGTTYRAGEQLLYSDSAPCASTAMGVVYAEERQRVLFEYIVNVNRCCNVIAAVLRFGCSSL